jgi:hypothetical protein
MYVFPNGTNIISVIANITVEYFRGENIPSQNITQLSLYLRRLDPRELDTMSTLQYSGVQLKT